MLYLAFGIILASMCMSAFFSGSETAFYRASRVKILMSALEGDRLSKFLVWLTNQPAFLVGTLLVGNNIANYLVSFGVVMGSGALLSGDHSSGELIASLLITPLLFVYGEALPKSLCYQAPNRLLRLGAFPLFLCAVILLPISFLLWGMSRLLERMVGQSPEKLRLALARKEIEDVLDEGHQVGILHASQRQLSQNFFLVAGRPIRQVCLPMNRIVSIKPTTSRAAAIRIAQRHSLADIPVMSDRNELLGYVHLVDMLIMPPNSKSLPSIKPLSELKSDELFGEAILWMQTHRESLVKVIGKQNQPVGLLAMDQLTSQLLRGSLESLRR